MSDRPPPSPHHPTSPPTHRSPCPRWSPVGYITDRRHIVHRIYRQNKRVGRTGRPVTHCQRNCRTPTLIARRVHRHRPTRPASTQHNVRVRHQPLGTAARTQCQIIRVRILQRHRQRTRRRVFVGHLVGHITNRRRVVHRIHRQNKRVGRTGRPVTHCQCNRRTPVLVARRGDHHRPVRTTATQYNVHIWHQTLGTADRTQCQIRHGRLLITQRHRQLTVAVSSLVTWLATSLIVGTSLTPPTVKTKVSVELAVPSLTVSVIVALPL